jgi:hypothetical protein
VILTADTHLTCYNNDSQIQGSSSVGQSIGLQNRGSQVRFLSPLPRKNPSLNGFFRGSRLGFEPYGEAEVRTGMSVQMLASISDFRASEAYPVYFAKYLLPHISLYLISQLVTH